MIKGYGWWEFHGELVNGYWTVGMRWVDDW
jgi:hypothetical protein